MSYARQQLHAYRDSTAMKAGLWGLAGLTASAVLVQYLARRAEANHRPTGKLQVIGDRTVHVVDRGSGPPVIVLHGNGSMVEDPLSSTVIDLLAERHRVIAIDRPGFGLSDRNQSGEWTPEREAQHLATIIRTMGLKRPVVVAHSWATLAALSLALDEPDLVSGLVLISGYYYPSVRTDVAAQSIVALPLIGDLLRHTFLPLFARATAPHAFKRMFSPLNPSKEFLRQYSVPMATRPSQLRSVAHDTATMPKAAGRVSARYAELLIPIELIAGSEDRIVSTTDQSERLQSELPNSSLEVVKGAGHMVHHAHPRLVERRVKSVFDRAPEPLAQRSARV
jgi:pimeloyl-ACP methyl ester carboxylesterase